MHSKFSKMLVAIAVIGCLTTASGARAQGTPATVPTPGTATTNDHGMMGGNGTSPSAAAPRSPPAASPPAQGSGMMGGGTVGRQDQGMKGGSMADMMPMMMSKMNKEMMGVMNKDMEAQTNMMMQMTLMMQMNLMVAEMHQMTSDCDRMMEHTGKAPGMTAKPSNPAPQGE